MKSRQRWITLCLAVSAGLSPAGCGTPKKLETAEPTPAIAATRTPTGTRRALTAAPTTTIPAASALPPTETPRPPATETPAPAEKALTDPAATLDSLEKVDDYPLYTMRYYGDYGRSMASSREIGGAASTVADSEWACSLFAALGDGRQRVYGRSFDWQYSPALLLFTDPPEGYDSVSMVDIGYLVESAVARDLPDLPLAAREPLLAAPFWPFDGMNEHGLVIGMAAVSDSETPYDPDKPTIDSLTIIREMLDHARDVDEAISIVDQYNIDWGGGPALHYLIADAAGEAVLIEFLEGQMVLIANPHQSPWHLATNHLRSRVAPDGPSGCWRYDAIDRDLAGSQGRMGVEEALDLLTDVAQDSTQWSVVYDLTRRGIHVAMGRAYDRVHRFELAQPAP